MIPDKSAEVEEAMRKLLVKILRKEKVVLDRKLTFKQIGADSLDIIQLMIAIEETFDIELIDEDCQVINDIGGFIDYVKKRVSLKQCQSLS